jgi:hypothetical protein
MPIEEIVRTQKGAARHPKSPHQGLAGTSSETVVVLVSRQRRSSFLEPTEFCRLRAEMTLQLRFTACREKRGSLNLAETDVRPPGDQRPDDRRPVYAIIETPLSPAFECDNVLPRRSVQRAQRSGVSRPSSARCAGVSSRSPSTRASSTKPIMRSSAAMPPGRRRAS